MINQTFRPDHKVILRRADNNYADEDISNDVVSISTNKAYARAAGGFQLTTTFKPFIADKRYDEVVKPDDIILISLDAGDGTGMLPVMVGLVDRVGRIRSYDGEGRPQFRCRINGMDFGKLLTKHNCIVDVTPLQDTESGNVKGGEGTEWVFRAQKGLPFSGKPQELVSGIHSVLFKDQLTLPKDYCDVWFPDVAIDQWATYDFPVLETTGSVWNAMKTLSNEPFNVLTTETYGDRFYVILEKYPFDDKSGKLTLTTARPAEKRSGYKVQPGIPADPKGRGRMYAIPDQLIVNEDLGIADNERINYLYLKAPNFILFGEGGAGQAMSFIHGIQNDPLEKIKVHGFIPWEVNIPSFAPPVVSAEGPMPNGSEVNEIKARAEILWNRVKNNHTLESGNITVHGMPWFKCGDGALLDNDMEYFVEQVTHSYQINMNGTSYTTALGLTRGQAHTAQEYDP
jgi:hypothetical protein